MTRSRRDFLIKSGTALAATSLLPYLPKTAPLQNQLTGLQLYCVRDEMKKDPEGTLEQLSKMGYRHVEHAGYSNRKFYGFTPLNFKMYLEGLGMRMPSGHSVLDKKHWDGKLMDFTDEWKQLVADFAEAGGEYIFCPWLDQSRRKDIDTLKAFMEIYNKCGEYCKTQGVMFGYHNHDFEFNTRLEGKLLYDLILELTEPDLVAQQLDIGNMLKGGGMALDVINKYPGRFVSLHVKDMIDGSKEMESTILGTGLVPVKKAIDQAKAIGGTRHFIIEQESYQDKTPLECMEINLNQMKEWGY